MADAKKNCFVITPIGSENSPIRRHIEIVIDRAIEPAIDEDYNIWVSHRIDKIGSITRQIVELINDCELVIANLTNLNPNVMYELALRHATGKPVIVIAEKGTELPFDIADERTIFYLNDTWGIDDLRDEIIKIVKKIDLDMDKPTGPIFDIINSMLFTKNLDQMVKQNPDDGMLDAMRLLLTRFDHLEYQWRKIEQSNLDGKDKRNYFHFYFTKKHNRAFSDPVEILLYDVAIDLLEKNPKISFKEFETLVKKESLLSLQVSPMMMQILFENAQKDCAVEAD